MDNVTGLQKFESTDVRLLLAPMDPESVAAEAFRFEKSVSIFEKEGVVNGGSQLDMTDVARAVINSEATGGTRRFVVEG